MFIHEYVNWFKFRYNVEKLVALLATVRHLQGKLMGQMESLSFSLREEAMLTTLTLDVLKSAEIEEKLLDK